MIFVRKLFGIPYYFYHSIMTKRLFRAKDVSASRRHFEKIRSEFRGFMILPHSEYHEAFHATLLLHEDRIDDARKLYASVKQGTAHRRDPNGQYVNHYCTIILDKLGGRKIAEEFISQTKKIDCAPYIKGWLPLS